MNIKIGKILGLSLAFFSLLVAPIVSQSASLSNKETELEKKNGELAREAAGEGMVLLDNKNGTLPISTMSHKNIALYGCGAYATVKGGTGSGFVNNRQDISIQEGLINAGFNVTNQSYLQTAEHLYWIAEEEASASSGFWYSFIYEEPRLSAEDLLTTDETDTAIYVLARNSGEGNDRNLLGDYEITENERANFNDLTDKYNTVIIILNVGGVIDTKWYRDNQKFDALLLMSQAGQEGGNAVVDVLTGSTTPSGKLSDTWAENYHDYPASATFANNDGDSLQEDYQEDIYVGYRYFDTFNISPAYEFGYGDSYTEFNTEVQKITATNDFVTLTTKVTNMGDIYSGKEVVQVYYSAPNSQLEVPYQELIAYAKTKKLAPGESQILEISYQTKEMSSYDESKSAYTMASGDYLLRLGNSSRHTKVVAKLVIENEILTTQVTNQFPLDKELKVISRNGINPYSYTAEKQEISDAPVLTIASRDFVTQDQRSPYEDEAVVTYIPQGDDYISNSQADYQEIIQEVMTDSSHTLLDVYNKTIDLSQFVAGLELTQLAKIVNGVSGGSSEPSIGAQANSVKGAAGETVGDYFDLKIPNLVLADGPAGVRVTQQYREADQEYYQFATAWPIGTALAQTWNNPMVKQIGVAIGEEMAELGVTLWLAPGMNIHRDPLCGRNFEYYSEDPFLTGLMAVNATLGVQETPGVGATIKHFALNNQETSRSRTNSTATERAIREIYLKGYEMTVKAAQPMAIMTSYNKINGIYAAANYKLNTNIARGEWGFEGLIMTDWFARADKGESMHAGNDLLMPGGGVSQVVAAVENGQITLGDVQKSVMAILSIVQQSSQFAKLTGVPNRSYIDQYESLADYLVISEQSDIPVELLEINVNAIKTIKKNKKLTMTASVSPENATSQTVIWTVEQPRIASISKNGEIKAHQVGLTKVNARTSNGKNASFILRVTP